MAWYYSTVWYYFAQMRSHTGATMVMGKGSLYSTSTRQKINTKSSTEAELVGVDDEMPMILWTKYFLETQGYQVKDSSISQDNQSAILLKKMGGAQVEGGCST